MSPMNDDTTVVLHTTKPCACCGHRYGQHGCVEGDCMLAPIPLAEMHDATRYIAEQARHLEVTPFGEIPDAPRTAVEAARALIARDNELTLHDLEAYMVDSGFSLAETHDAVSHLVLVGFCEIDDHQALTLIAKPEQVVEIPRPTWGERIRAWIATVWHRCWGGIVLLIATSCFALGLRAQDVPRWILVGIAAVETGTEYRDLGDVRGTWSRGDIGEVGPWQLSPAVLRDLRAYDRRARVHADPVLAESLTRAWLVHLYGVTGNWPGAVAAYHAGLAARHRPYAIDYANRVGAIGHSAGLQILAR